MISLDAVPLLKGFSSANMAAQKLAVKQILPYTDILGISLHPFVSAYKTSTFPFDIFRSIRKLTNKSIAITETSYPAQQFTITINGSPVLFEGSNVKQQRFYNSLLKAAKRDRYEFVLVFTFRDYDGLWNAVGRTDTLLVWRDTGLYSETGARRSALSLWQAYFKKRWRKKF